MHNYCCTIVLIYFNVNFLHVKQCNQVWDFTVQDIPSSRHPKMPLYFEEVYKMLSMKVLHGPVFLTSSWREWCYVLVFLRKLYLLWRVLHVHPWWKCHTEGWKRTNHLKCFMLDNMGTSPVFCNILRTDTCEYQLPSVQLFIVFFFREF